MTSNIDALRIRKNLGPDRWGIPVPYGPDGWYLVNEDDKATVIISCAEHDGTEWVHASIAYNDRQSDYDDLCMLHHAVFGSKRYSYQVFPPAAAHVNIHPNALHLWGRLDGRAALPEFAEDGSI
jgi:hypothetical protein